LERLRRFPRFCSSGGHLKLGKMTGEQSRQLKVGDKVCWQKDNTDQSTVTETGLA
jgi:hypothetical protein